ncbi:TadA family conjugal transfer-associated ATPase [Agromyces sp. LHK192]|uniref:TadA family conjugal transfer-associated ATPase n=1 Tax=Agromyces sp. LHK192 TaxID=2498704 RepID=UPI000FDC79F2|nr:TadA family conjugal transfer-associated ATPase [Agromyces sp. LHK192]
MTIPFVARPSWEDLPAVEEASPWADARARPTSAEPHGHLAEAPSAVAEDRSVGIAGFAAKVVADDVGDGGVASAGLDLLGPLAGYAAAGPVTDLFVNGDRGLWIDRGAGPVREPAWVADEAEVRALAVKLIARGGRHVDESSPAVDVRLGRGIRVHVVLPPVSAAGTLISVRVPRAGGFSLAALGRAGMLRPDEERMLRDAVAARRNLLVTGAGGTGKTTLLAALLAEAAQHERLVVIEDVAELQVPHPHAITLEARQPNLEGAGRIGLDALLREALRMRPDRLVVGECRGAELRELLAALNTGHDGGAGTLHANSLEDVPARLEALGAIAAMTAEAVARQTVSAFDLVVHLERGSGGRRVGGIGAFRLDERGRLAVERR